MGAALTRQGDTCSGHGCYPPRMNTAGSPSVFANGLPVHRQGDAWAVHACGSSSHAGNLSAGSGSVFANGLPVGRIGDAVSCGSVAAKGSSNVFAGG